MSETEAIDGTAEDAGTELVPAQAPAPTTLFRTDDPVEVLTKATAVADALKSVLSKQGMIQNIQGKEHVRVEGWTTLGAMLGVVPVVVWTRKLDRGWEARVEARTLDGRVIGAAEAECLKDEARWRSAEDYAVRSMAQTRATSKALGGPLRFIVTLAGYEATPAEEMDGVQRQTSSGATPASDAQKGRIRKDFKRLSLTIAQIKAVFTKAGVLGVQDISSKADVDAVLDRLAKHQASAVIDVLAQGALPDPEHPALDNDASQFVHPPEGAFGDPDSPEDDPERDVPVGEPLTLGDEAAA